MRHAAFVMLTLIPVAAVAQPASGPSQAAIAQAIGEDTQQHVLVRAQMIDLAARLADAQQQMAALRATAAEKENPTAEAPK